MTEVHDDIEARRVQAVAAYSTIGAGAQPHFAGLVAVASYICETPLAGISLIDGDHERFLAATDNFATDVPRSIAICDQTIKETDILVVGDLSGDARFSANPLVSGPIGLRFYAGVPLRDVDGYALGALCVADRRPRQLSGKQMEALGALARAAEAVLALHRSRVELTALVAEAGRSNTALAAVQTAASRLIGNSDEASVIRAVAECIRDLVAAAAGTQVTTAVLRISEATAAFAIPVEISGLSSHGALLLAEHAGLADGTRALAEGRWQGASVVEAWAREFFEVPATCSIETLPLIARRGVRAVVLILSASGGLEMESRARVESVVALGERALAEI